MEGNIWLKLKIKNKELWDIYNYFLNEYFFKILIFLVLKMKLKKLIT